MKHAPEVIAQLVKLAKTAESEAARVAACNAVLDRAMGKPKQPLVGGGDDDAPISTRLTVTFV